MLTFTTSKPEGMSEDIIQEMSLLLSGGKMPANISKIIMHLYEKAAQPGGTFNCKCYLERYKDARDMYAYTPPGGQWEITQKVQFCVAPLDAHRFKGRS